MAIPNDTNSKEEARSKNIVDGTNELVWLHAENIDDSSLRPITYFEAGDENKRLVPGAPHLSSTTAIDSDSSHLLPKIDGSIASHSNYFKSGKKRKETKSQEKHVTVKKQRLVWTSKLHSMFVRVVHRLGVESAVPKKILENMRRSGAINLTRENVASHLQKYRLFLRRKENKDHGKMSNIPSQSVSLNGSKESNFKQTSITDEALYIENSYNYDSFDHLSLQNLGIDIVSPHDQIMLPYSRNVLAPLDQNILQDSKSHILEPQRPSHDTGWCVHGGMIETFESLPTLSNLQPKLGNEVYLLPGDDMISSNFPHPHPPIMSVQYDVVNENHHLSDIRSGSVDMSPWLNDFLDESLSNFIDNHGNVHVGGYGNANETNFYVSNSSHGALDSYLEREFDAKFNPFVNHPDNASN